MILSFINIRKVPREMLKTSGFAFGFQHLPRDLANVNEWKIMFDPYNTVTTKCHKITSTFVRRHIYSNIITGKKNADGTLIAMRQVKSSIYPQDNSGMLVASQKGRDIDWHMDPFMHFECVQSK